jgi:DNA-binding transcriptional LysR family regulator
MFKNLWKDSYSVIARKDHPKFKTDIQLEDFCSANHVMISPQGDLQGPVSEALKKIGKKHKIVSGVSSFYSAPHLVSTSDFIATIPSKFAKSVQTAFQLLVLTPPLKVQGFQLKMIWHKRTDSSQVHVWLRNHMKAISSSIELDSFKQNDLKI